MKRHDLTLSIAMAAALAAHAGLIYVAVEAEAYGWGVPERVAKPRAAEVRAEESIAEAVPVPPEAMKPPDAREFVMGRAGGAGEAVNQDDSTLEQSAPVDSEVEQAWQAREKAGKAELNDPNRPDDPGEHGKNGQADLASPEMESERKSLRTEAETSLTSHKPFKKRDADAAKPDPSDPNLIALGPAPVNPTNDPSRPAAPDEPDRKPGEKVTDAGDAKKGAPGDEPAATAGRPVPESDRDADLVGKKLSAQYTTGHVEVQAGREVKFASPRRHLAAFVDMAAVPSGARVVLSISIDAAGKVRDAKVLKGCGSASLDRAFQLAAFESWFEPAKNADGTPVADVIEFEIGIL